MEKERQGCQAGAEDLGMESLSPTIDSCAASLFQSFDEHIRVSGEDE